MMTRLAKMGDYGSLQDVQVETFNSFCEKILRQYNDLVYEKPVRVITYKDKIIMIKKAVAKLNMSLSTAIDNYFSFAQKRGKMEEQLANIFMNDCFFLRDYCKFKNNSLDKKRAQDNFTGKMVFAVCNFIEAHMKKQGLRDFADQLLDAIALFEKRPDLLPEYEHILIDEYQDVNSTQIKLVDLLAAPNLFAVGDPRQSIFGWRGSDVKYILQFEEKYPQCETVTLTKNYRSSKHIVNLVNESIRNMRLADLESPLDGKKDIHLLTFNSEESESEFVIQRILASELPRNEIFVLARTNRQLNELSQRMRVRRIRHVVRSDEMKNSIMAGEDEITLATIHAIKGMEAELVFVIGCHGINFPCKGSEHPVMELVDIEEYDKEEEERRLFYVAMSRAKNSLYLSYSGAKPTYFITDKMLGMIEENEVKVKPVSLVKKSGVSNPSTDVLSRLKEWRTEMSRQLGVAPYMIMHDKTMFDIVEKVPMTKVELESVYGMGPMKIKKYGEELLRVVGG